MRGMKEPYDIMREYMIRPKGMFIWRDIPGYEGMYQVSNHGEVCSIWNKYLNQGSQVVLKSIDKVRSTVSIKKLLKAYWHQSLHNKGNEEWKKLDRYGDYYISNYGNVKNCRRLVLLQTAGKVTLQKKVEGKKVIESISVIKLFLNSFPPYEVNIDHDTKTINYIKKNENQSHSSLKKSA